MTNNLLKGTMLKPGVSANGRLYTKELIQKAFEKLVERINDGTDPVTMLTHHEAGDNSREIVGRVTGVTMNGDNLDYTAALADTDEATTISKLVSPQEGQQFLRGVSIRGWWCGEPTTTTFQGRPVTTADDMEIDGLDFTKSPGVPGAFVAPSDSTATETDGSRVMIHESAETRAVFTEVVNKKPYGTVRYADPGYQDDKVKRYPLDTKAHAKAAWSYINQAGNQKLYTAAQLKRIRARIKGALQKFGVDVTTEAAAMPQVFTEANTTLSECYACSSPDGTAGFSISAYNGPLTVTVSAYNGVEPADLSDVAMIAMQAACDAIHALDPDDDGDIDEPGTTETAPASPTVKESEMGETTTPAPAEVPEEETPAEETPEEETPAEETPEEEAPAETEESAPITRADLEAAVTAAVATALAPPEEAAPEADDELRETIRQEVIKEAVEKGLITRKGLVEKVDAEPEKPLHEMNEDEFRKYQEARADLFFAHNQ